MKFDDDRFIKLPIESYLELLGVTPNTSQTALINAVSNPKYRFVCAAVARRQGKTYISNIILPILNLFIMDLAFCSSNMYFGITIFKSVFIKYSSTINIFRYFHDIIIKFLLIFY